MKKGQPASQPRHDNPLPKESSYMILKLEPERIGKLNLEKRGESGTRLQASPDPHRPHSPKLEIQGVR